MNGRMSIREFREVGLLQELNRLFLHPLGLALEVIIDNETGVVAFGGIWQTDDPEGFVFEEINKAKVDYVEKWAAEMAVSRKRALGYVIQHPD